MGPPQGGGSGLGLKLVVGQWDEGIGCVGCGGWEWLRGGGVRVDAE